MEYKIEIVDAKKMMCLKMTFKKRTAEHFSSK